MTICSLLVFARRARNAWSAAGIAPGVALTSGYEEESLFALYRSAHGSPVYLDTTHVPFASAYFNWLFYAINGAFLKPIVAQQGDAAIPRATRIFSAVGSLLGTITLVLFGSAVLPRSRTITFPLAVFVFCGPLVGWWAHTARPDVWALACETGALAVLLRYFRERKAWAAWPALLLFYAAWSFKPTYVFGLGTAIIFLALRRRFGMAAILVFGSVGLWIATYAFLGPEYREAMHNTAVTNIFYFNVGWANLVNAVTKTAPFLILVAWVLFWRSGTTVDDSSSLPADTRLLGGLGVVLTTVLSFVASCKLGAASNYFFTPLLMLALLALGLLAYRPRPVAFAVFLSLAATMQILAFTGRLGQIDLRPAQTELATRWSIWERQAEPRFSADTRLNLPWLSPNSPPLVLAFNYGLDRSAGRKFEMGGVGGLISSGFFAALLLPEGQLTEYDRGNLHRYHKDSSVAGMTLYLRNNP